MTHSVHTLNIDFKASVPFCFTTFKNVSLMNISEEKTLCLLFFIEDRKSIKHMTEDFSPKALVVVERL